MTLLKEEGDYGYSGVVNNAGITKDQLILRMKLEDFENVILFLETSEELPDSSYVSRVLRALGE
jgi:muramoyltetrapeptide carboxypeptidase LdcA involved in peptidoglycan recycling